jgi:phenylacetate-CoA ligase
LSQLRRAARTPPAELRALQERRLRDLVRHAYRDVAYLRRLWQAAGVLPGDVRGLADLSRLPFTSKAILREAPLEELLASGAAPDRCTVLDSSGSSGRPFRVYKRAREERFRRAAGLRILFEHGFRWRDRSVQLQQLAGPAVWLQSLGVARKRWIATDQALDAQLEQLAEARADVVIGPPTALRAVARAAQAAGRALPRARLVVAAGELLDPGTRRLVHAVLGADPVAVYGMTETGYLAWQCERRAGLHVSADTHLVEILRGETPAPPGTLGEVVVTDLVARTMPLVRYRTGDLARAARCECGRGLPVLVHGGRVAGTLQLPDGGLVTATEVVGALDGRCALGAFVVVQERPDAVRLELLPPPTGPDDPAADEAASTLAALVRPLRVESTRIDTLPGGGTGKTPIVVSRLPPPF